MSLILASVAFTQYALFSWPPFFYMDRIGRRWTVMLSSIGCGACMFIIAGCLLSTTYACAAAATAFMFFYMDCFTMGILPVSWSYAAETQPLRVRNKAMAVGVFSHWLSNVSSNAVAALSPNAVLTCSPVVRCSHGHTDRVGQHPRKFLLDLGHHLLQLRPSNLLLRR